MMGGLLLIGAGGHAKVVIEALRAAGAGIAGLVAPDAAGAQALGLRLLGDDDALPRLRAEGLSQAVLALGDNRRRCALAAQLRELGFALPVVVHPAAWVSPSALIRPPRALRAGPARRSVRRWPGAGRAGRRPPAAEPGQSSDRAGRQHCGS